MAFIKKGYEKRWPNGTVPFTLDPSIENDPNAKQQVELAIQHWQANTPIRFVPRTRQDDFVVFKPASGFCQSDVGVQGGEQAVRCDLSSGLFSSASIIHEIGHTVQLLHEQKRPDRDQFVIVDPSVLHDINYKILWHQRPLGAYDCTSVMHYPSLVGKIQKKPGGCKAIGGSVLTAEDAQAVRFLYPLSKVGRGRWGPGWTHLVPFDLNRTPHLFKYNRDTGRVTIDRIAADGSGTTQVGRGKWSKGWTSIVSFVLGGVPHLFEYNRDTGRVTIDRIAADGSGTTQVGRGNVGDGWSGVVGLIRDPPYFLIHRHDGRLRVYRLHPDAQGMDETGRTDSTSGWTTFAPLNLGGHLHVIRYKLEEGIVAISILNAL